MMINRSMRMRKLSSNRPAALDCKKSKNDHSLATKKGAVKRLFINKLTLHLSLINATISKTLTEAINTTT